MPVECSVQVVPIDQDRFHAVDRVLMGHAFDIHNTLGRFCNDSIYQAELAHRCMASGLEVHREVLLRVTYKDFAKPYYLDLLVERGLIYELKAVESLGAAHQKQLINYLLLTELRHGKLVNFHPGSVESRYVSTRLDKLDRMDIQVDDTAWKGSDKLSQNLRATMLALLEDWGAFLDAELYREALLHFLAAPEAGLQSVDIEMEGRVLGQQTVCILYAGTAWHLSAVRQHLQSYETHISRLLHHTRLEQIHWINLDQRLVTFKTLKKSFCCQ